MKLSVNFDALWQKVYEMGAEEVLVAKAVSWDRPVVETIDKEIHLDDIESSNGLLMVKNNQILLYMPDHKRWVTGALQTPGQGNKFHIADCKKLHEMRSKKRYNSYMVTNNLSTTFNVFGVDQLGKKVVGEATLHVCKNCLNLLNYQGAANASTAERRRIAENFDIGIFFATYSSLFSTLPKGIANTSAGYTDNWPSVSRKIRQSAHFTCAECHVNLTDYPHLLHVHHINGVKHDNSANNLIPLCCDCHRKQPLHEHMCISHRDTQVVNRLRREQGVIVGGLENWPQVMRYADPALYGILDHAKARNYSVPTLGYTLSNGNFETPDYLELAWLKARFGIYIDPPKQANNWRLLSIKDAMAFFARGHR
ncbi:MAG: hypothetical protein PUP46_11015 [Endozoicomonas sp. (ex Botrylloides leachii)]|nr:hypothetical protein [Endozoicomonas sp. (ex Botrylloides leachii)]